jgi:hypothetical protein
MSIERLQGSAKCPNKFRVQARIIEFDPLDLVDAMILHCANCKKEYVCFSPGMPDNADYFCSSIPRARKACIDCADVDHEYVRYLYQMHILLQADDGQTLLVSVNDQVCFFPFQSQRTCLLISIPCSVVFSKGSNVPTFELIRQPIAT